MRWIQVALSICAVVGLCFCLGAAWQDDDKVQANNQRFMLAKMKSAKAIVEGLALENFDTLQESAQNLILISNESAWNVFQSEEYLKMSTEFRGSADRLRKAAEEKNVDAATLAYFEMTMSCVRCHKYVRHRK
jgi:cytochrome c556